LFDQWYSDAREDWMIFVAAGHSNEVANHNMEPLEMVNLNLEAGERAVQVSAFVPASQYFQQGISCLQTIESYWEVHYNLSLRLYNASADVELCLGHFDEEKQAIFDTILENAKYIQTKLRVYLSLSMALGRLNRHEESLDIHMKGLQLIREFLKNLHSSQPELASPYGSLKGRRFKTELVLTCSSWTLVFPLGVLRDGP
jgi:predicted ATPase